MMWRTNMPEGEAMLFAFADATPRSFYMKNTYVPLSIAYIDTQGVIQEIHDLHPRNEEPVPSTADNIQFVPRSAAGLVQATQRCPGRGGANATRRTEKHFLVSPAQAAMSKPTDVRVVATRLYFLPVQMRMPLKFGTETTTSVTCARVCVTVEDATESARKAGVKRR